ncbi:MAG TPA: S8 family serine peptidase [Candidatus Polarisedimenticolia bacterium]|nr:S8 family serine peptidase [Candidatus Polarisedimenticolia bacterium]
MRIVPPSRFRTLSTLGLAFVLVLALVPSGASGGGRTIVPGIDPDPGPLPDPGASMEDVLIRFHPPYDALVEKIRAAGGEVRHAFGIVDAVSATVPRSALPALGRFAGTAAVLKDPPIAAPEQYTSSRFERSLPSGKRRGERAIVADSLTPITEVSHIAGLAAAHPDSYLVNAGILGVSSLHAHGIQGQGVVVAVIDTGLKPNYPHLEFDGSILGGEDFAHDGFSWRSVVNDGHGTFVAGMISGNVMAQFTPTSQFLAAIRRYAPGAIVGANSMPIVGSAPSSGIFVMRVFSPFISIPGSAILEAMEEVLVLRDAWREGNPGGLNISVVNMSLSMTTLHPGHDLFETAADQLVDHGVVVVESAGNAGPSGVTVGSPGTSRESLDVGAASLAHNERILRDLQWGPGLGLLYRPFDGPETALFSSRGPLADGRPGPDVTASGYASMGMGFSGTGGISIASGTSFSSPTVAGVAALLRQSFPDATARQIRNAIVMSANPDYLQDGSTINDQGAGYVNGQAAWDLLAAGTVPDTTAPLPHAVASVAANLSMNAGVTVDTGTVSRRVGPLKPGGRAELYYQVPPNVQAVNLVATPIHPLDGPRNQIFGEDIIVAVHTAKTGRHRNFDGDGDYLVTTFVIGSDPVTIPLDASEPGVMRVTVTGDWTNAGEMSADLALSVVQVPAPMQTLQGRINEFQTIEFPFTVPPGAQRVEARLSWQNGWEGIPLNDIDLTLLNPYDFPDDQAATLNVPERTLINDPVPGPWKAQIYGFEMPTRTDKFKLRILIDGEVVR